jgi:hypothetical protein
MNNVIVIDDDSSEDEQGGNPFHQPNLEELRVPFQQVGENPKLPHAALVKFHDILGAASSPSIENLSAAYFINGQDVGHAVIDLLEIQKMSLRPMLEGFQRLAQQRGRRVDLNAHDKMTVGDGFQVYCPDLKGNIWFNVAKYGVQEGYTSLTIETPLGNSFAMARPKTRASSARKTAPWRHDQDSRLMKHAIFDGREFEDIVIEDKTTESIKVSLRVFTCPCSCPCPCP